MGREFVDRLTSGSGQGYTNDIMKLPASGATQGMVELGVQSNGC
jgi:hypothetical protein